MRAPATKETRLLLRRVSPFSDGQRDPPQRPVWLTPTDPYGATPSYAHPDVVGQDHVFNHSRITTVVVCAMTSNPDVSGACV